VDVPVVLPKVTKAPAALTEDDRHVYAKGDRFAYAFSKQYGMFDSLVIDGRERLAGPVSLTAYRAIIDNEMFCYQNWKYDTQFNAENMDRAFTQVYGVTVSDGVIEAKCSLAGVSRVPMVRYTLKIAVYEDGGMDWTVDAEVRDWAAWIPRFGFEFPLAQKDLPFRYFGRGPGDNYSDMRHHACLDWFDSTAAAEYVPFIMPQEHGNHTGVRSLSIDGLTFEAAERSFEANVSAYTILQLDRAKHVNEIGESTGTHLRIDYRNAGVGSQSCGPELIPEHKITEKQIAFAFSIRI